MENAKNFLGGNLVGFGLFWIFCQVTGFTIHPIYILWWALTSIALGAIRIFEVYEKEKATKSESS